MLIVLLTHSGSGDRRVAVDDRRARRGSRPPTAYAHRQPELVGLAGRLAEERELPHAPGRAALHRSGMPGVGDDELAVVEHDVADEPVEERLDLVAELVGSRVELLERLGQAVGDLDVAAAQLAEQLDVVVAGHAERVPGGDHRHHQCAAPPACRGPRSTRSPTKTAVRPVGVASHAVGIGT